MGESFLVPGVVILHYTCLSYITQIYWLQYGRQQNDSFEMKNTGSINVWRTWAKNYHIFLH